MNRIVSLVIGFAMALICVSCRTNIKTLKPPNLTAAINSAQNQTRRAKLILVVLDKDIEDAKRLRQGFFSQDKKQYRAPYPLALFKQTAMACLNQPVGANVAEEAQDYQVVKRVLQKLDIKIICTPSSFPLLIQTLTLKAPQSMSWTLQQLERVDQMRMLRSQVRARTSKLTPLMRQQRLLLDEQRLDLRRLRQKINRQKRDYNPKDYEQARRRLSSYQRELNRFDNALKAIIARRQSWRALLQDELKQFYFDLADLYAQDPFKKTP